MGLSSEFAYMKSGILKLVVLKYTAEGDNEMDAVDTAMFSVNYLSTETDPS